jgi:hypothetical protein
MPNTFKSHGRIGYYTYWLMQAPWAAGLPMQAGLYIFAAADAANPQPVFIEETRSLRGRGAPSFNNGKLRRETTALAYFICTVCLGRRYGRRRRMI